MTQTFRGPPPRGRSLHGTLLFAAILVVSITAVVMVGSVSLAISWRDAGKRENQAYLDDERIADDVRALAKEQQLSAYRYLQTHDAGQLDAFRARGNEADRQVHEFLFRNLSMDVRLRAESIKEAHQQFEVAAERTFELIRSAQTRSALIRLDSLDIRAAALNTAVTRFLEARGAQRDIAELRYELFSERLRIALAILTIAFVGAGVFLSGLLRRIVLRPLHQLAEVATRLGDGDADSRLPQQAYREFDVAATVFNQMAHRLQLSAENAVAQNRSLQDTLDNLHETQEELVQLEKLSAMGQMLAGLAHELNNPLGGVLGMAECLRLELSESPDAATRDLGVELAVPLEREALRARSLVRNLLSFSRKPATALESVNLSLAVHTAAGLRAHSFAEMSMRLRVDVAAGLYVVADAQKLQHAVVNLMNNALDALVEGHGTQLEIRASENDTGGVILEFDDDGPGMPNVEAAFRPFFTTKEVGKGTGLGLSLVKRFLNEFGGSVSATNRPEGGARVTMLFRRAAGPISPAIAAPVEAAEAAPAKGATPSFAESALRSGRTRVLIVDDEPAIREIERRSLTRAGFDVIAASSGIEARDLMLRESVDLVVSDLRMPGAMDGRALYEWMCVERPELARSVLLVTGNMAGPDNAALPLPASRTISKPFVGTELVSRVRAALHANEDVGV